MPKMLMCHIWKEKQIKGQNHIDETVNISPGVGFPQATTHFSQFFSQQFSQTCLIAILENDRK